MPDEIAPTCVPWRSTRRSASSCAIVMSVRRCFAVSFWAAPLVYGWCATPVTGKRLIRFGQPSRLASAPRSREPRSFTQKSGWISEEQLLDAALPMTEGSVIVGQASVLASQPEFGGAENLRRLLTLTEEPARLADALLRKHEGDERPGATITIGGEHGDPRLDQFTVVTAEYHAGALTGPGGRQGGGDGRSPRAFGRERSSVI